MSSNCKHENVVFSIFYSPGHSYSELTYGEGYCDITRYCADCKKQLGSIALKQDLNIPDFKSEELEKFFLKTREEEHYYRESVWKVEVLHALYTEQHLLDNLFGSLEHSLSGTFQKSFKEFLKGYKEIRPGVWKKKIQRRKVSCHEIVYNVPMGTNGWLGTWMGILS